MKKTTGPKIKEKEDMCEEIYCSECGGQIIGGWVENGTRKLCLTCRQNEIEKQKEG